jgi:hypothetical protein
MDRRSRAVLCFALLGASTLSLMGCESVRSAAGLTKEGPDEFAIVTKQPLIIPPEYNLRPPRDGAPPTNQVAPTDTAQAALFDTDPANAAKMVKGDYSQAEKLLLAQTGATNPDPSIRQLVTADGRAMEAADDGFTQQVLFWQDSPPKDPGTNVDAEGEDRRLSSQKAAGQSPTTSPAAKPKPPKDSATIQDDEPPADNNSGHSGMWSWLPF